MGRADDTGSQLLYKHITMEMDRLLLAIGAGKKLLPLGCTFDTGKYILRTISCVSLYGTLAQPQTLIPPA